MTPKIPRLTPKKMIKILERKGFEMVKSKGSHRYYYNKVLDIMVCIPFHVKDFPIGTLHNIIRQTGLEIEDLQ